MPILPTEKLLKAFEQRVASATQVDLAVAWASPSNALDSLRKAARAREITVRAIVGVSGNGTDPQALRSLKAFADLKLADPKAALFHPKVYLFHSAGKSTCWVGSANFTLSAFENNVELVSEFFDEDNSLQHWFDSLWSDLSRVSESAIQEYAQNWRRPAPTSRSRKIQSKDSSSQPLQFLHPPPTTWDDYRDALNKCDAYWEQHGQDFTVLGSEWSWRQTIASGRDLISRDDWHTLTKNEIRMLLGGSKTDGNWGLLGAMRKPAISVLEHDKGRARRTVQEALRPLIEVGDQDSFPSAAVKAIESITSIKQIGPGVATRLVALARPDLGVSVNDRSARRLGELSNLSKGKNTLANALNYPKLLSWLYSQPWYLAPEPTDSLGRTIWSMRAALIDSFVYEHKPRK